MPKTALEEVTYDKLPHPNECDTFDGQVACKDLCFIEFEKLKKEWSILLDKFETLIVNATNHGLDHTAHLAEKRAAHLEDYCDD
ncbi:MAG: hypothetical protein ACKO0Z_07015 [Betaproteobacteria bacterium]